MLKTMMHPDAFATKAIGEADAWDEPRWPEHETYSSDYERAAASFHEPNIDLPAGRHGGHRRGNDPSAAYRAAQAYGRVDAGPVPAHEMRALRAEAPRGEYGGEVDHHAAYRAPSHRPAEHRPAEHRPAEHRAPAYARTRYEASSSEPAPHQMAEGRAPAYPPARGPAAPSSSPMTESSTMNDFRTLARTIEKMRGQQRGEPEHAPQEGTGRRSWLDDVRHSLHASEAPASPQASAPAAAAARHEPAPGRAIRSALEARIEDDGVRRSLAALTDEIGSLANRAELERLESALVDVVRRVTSLETRLREAKAPPQLISRPAPTITARSSMSASGTAAADRSAPPRLTAQMIDARIAERRQNAERAERRAASSQRAPVQLQVQSPQTAVAAYEPRDKASPRRLFR